jgi:hypothetical protein
MPKPGVRATGARKKRKDNDEAQSVSDIVESTAANKITFRAITAKAKQWVNDQGVPSGTANFQFADRAKTASAFRRAAKANGLKIIRA